MYTEETAAPGLWKSEVVGAIGVWLCASAFIVPAGESIFAHNFFVGLIATNVAIMMAGNRKWERPLATAAAIWLVMSSFVPSVLTQSLLANQLAVGVILVVAAISANMHLRDDIRHARPLTM